MSKEIFIEGKGLAGLNLADKLGNQGYDVALAGDRYKTKRSWFVLGSRMPEEVIRAIDSGNINAHELTGCRFLKVREDEVVDDFTVNLKGQIPKLACLMVDDRSLKDWYRDKIAKNPKINVFGSRTKVAVSDNDHFDIHLADGVQISSKIVIDASGSGSNLQRKMIPEVLNDDPLVLWIYGARMRGRFNPDIMIFPLKDKSTGRVSWISPWSESEADVIASDYCRLSEVNGNKGLMQDTFGLFKELSVDTGVCELEGEIEPISGKIRVVPVRIPSHGKNVFAVGDAAGQACPNMAEGVSTAIKQSTKLSEQFGRNPNLTPVEYYQTWRNGSYGQKPEMAYPFAESFLLDRLAKDEAGGNISFYKEIAQIEDPKIQLQILTERRIGARSALRLMCHLFKNPQIVGSVAFHFMRSKLIPITRSYEYALYGNNQIPVQ